MRLYLKSLVVMIGCFACVAIMAPVYAETTGEVGFTIQMIPEDNQVSKDKSYFDLRMTPGQEQVIHVRVTNTSAEESTFSVQVNQGYTNTQGFIDYQDSKEVAKNDYPLAIEDLLTYEKKVTVNAQESVDVPFTLRMPEKEFDGQLLAGIQITKEQEANDKQQQIGTDVGYTLGLKLTETENNVKRRLDLVNVEAQATFGQPTIVATLKNPTMDAIGHLVYEAKIVEKKTKKEVFTKTYDAGMELAPNSLYDFAIEYGENRLLAGEYTLQLTVSDAQKNKWTFDEDFTITKKKAQEINQVTVDKEKEPEIPWVLILSGGGIVLLVILDVWWWKKRNKE